MQLIDHDHARLIVSEILAIRTAFASKRSYLLGFNNYEITETITATNESNNCSLALLIEQTLEIEDSLN